MTPSEYSETSALNSEVNPIDLPERAQFIKERIQNKTFLRLFYRQVYNGYRDVISSCPKNGLLLEIGSGAGFVKEVCPQIKTSDLVNYYDNLDYVMDATNMPFENNTVSGIFMMNVFHHIPNVEKFLSEAYRCLLPGGRLYLFDQHIGPFSFWIYKFLHNEKISATKSEWQFRSTGPLSGANGALAWMVFSRDKKKFSHLYPNFEIVRYKPCDPLKYWLIGGLKEWSLINSHRVYSFVDRVDRFLAKLFPSLGSFVEIEILKK